MATATKILLSPVADTGIYSSGVREDTAEFTSKILQEDMEKHHVFFNDLGFHNHILHHLLSLYALGASPDDIQAAYKRNQSYQIPVRKTDKNIVEAMHEKSEFLKFCGNEKHYANFLAFFQQEIGAKGVDEVVNEYLFTDDERSESMLCRLFGGLIHPLIHLGFGLEFNQPAIVAQALAQTAVHEEDFGRDFLLPAEKLAGGIGKPGKSLLNLLNEVRGDETLAQSVHRSDENKTEDGVLARGKQKMLEYAAQYTVSESQMEERVAEMINTTVYYTSAAQRADKDIKFDFYLIHAVNASIFFSKLTNLPALDSRNKLRLLEWKGRLDIWLYISQGLPNLFIDEIRQYPAQNDWSTIFHRCVIHPADDGHIVKLARALAHGEELCRLSDKQELMIHGDMWLRIGNMVVDSTVDNNLMWIRSTGFDGAWENVKERAGL
ncbi:hypothetical protein N7495_001243 [Penicillium taxi]|uniref:uncharacterized protein n=1 Tax=Penicillium taxi TaxID=168475 RepID=UPI002545BC1C|nr:uncharacterized protein N7495_001243 [Penicillium taxi]KAJ5908561.1 hypothetical protein N7495_001243 [Penicillium taxi]